MQRREFLKQLKKSKINEAIILDLDVDAKKALELLGV